MSKKRIVKILKEYGLFEYYKNKDVDNDTTSIYLLDEIVLLDDLNYILNNKDDYLDTESFDYEYQLEFIEKIQQVKNILSHIN